MAASDDAAQQSARWTLVDDEGNVQGSDSDVGSTSSSDCVAVEEDVVSYHAKRLSNRSSANNSIAGSPPRNQLQHSTDIVQDAPSSSSWLGGFWTKSRSPNGNPANSNPMLCDSEHEEPLPSVLRDDRDTESLSSIEVISMPSDSHSDTEMHPKNQVAENHVTFDPHGVAGTDWDQHGDVVKAMCSTSVVSSTEGLSPSSNVEDMVSSSNSSQLDFLMVNHPSQITVPDVSEANDFPRGAVGGRASDEEDQIERSVGIAEPLPMMPHGQLPFSSVSVDNIPRGVETGDSPRRAQSEGCIPQQSEGSSGVGVPVMTQRWPTEDGGFLLVQQFRGDGEPAMSRSSSFSDLSSSFSYPGTGIRRRIPTNSCSSLNRQSSDTSSSEASHYNSDTSNDALPANMTVSGIKPGIRQYLHQRDESLNSKLTMAAMIVVTGAFALVLGHYIGSMQATSHHLGIEAGQVWRLRSLQDQLVTCLDKTKTLMRGARGSSGSPPPRASSSPDSHPTAKLLEPPDVIQQTETTLSCADCPSESQPTGYISEFCYLHCMQQGQAKDMTEQLTKNPPKIESTAVSNSNSESFLGNDGIGNDVDSSAIASQTQADPEPQVVYSKTNSLENDENHSSSDVDEIPFVDSDMSILHEEGIESHMDHMAVREAAENEGVELNHKDVPQDNEISHHEAPQVGRDRQSVKEYHTYDEAGYVKDEDMESKETIDDKEEISEQEEDNLDKVGELLQVENGESPEKEEDKLINQDQSERELYAAGSSTGEDTGEEEGVSEEKSSKPRNDGDFTEKLSSKLSESWFILRNFTTDLVGSAANLSVNNVTTQLKENVETLRHQIKDAVSSLQKSNISTNLKDNVKSIGEHLKHAVSNITEGGFSSTVKDTMQDLGETIQAAVSKAKETGRELKEPLKDTMKAVKDLMGGKPIKRRKPKNKDQSGQEEYEEVKGKPPVNNQKKKANKRSREQSQSEKKEAAKKKNKEERKKNFASQHGKNKRGGKKSNRGGNNNARKQKVTVENKKSHNLNVNAQKVKNHGNQHADQQDRQSKQLINSKELMSKDRNEIKSKLNDAQNRNENEEYSENKSVPSRTLQGDLKIEKRGGDKSFNFQHTEPNDSEEVLGNKKEKQFSKKRHQVKIGHEYELNAHHKENHKKQDQHHKKTEDQNHRQDRKHGKRDNDGQEHHNKEEDARRRFEDIGWDDIFEHFDVRCFGVHDCLRKHREAAVKLYEELLDYQDWLTERCYKKHLEELKDFMEELEEFLAEPFLKDADLEELMEDFEDMAEDIEEATTKNFWKFMKSWTPRRNDPYQSKSKYRYRQTPNMKKPLGGEEEKTLTVTLDLKKTFNISESADEEGTTESKNGRKHEGYGYHSNDDWFIRRMQDREESRNKDLHLETTEDRKNGPNWYDHWMQGRENGRTGMTVWDLYQWFSKRQALRHEWRLHEMDDQSNWFLRRP